MLNFGIDKSKILASVIAFMPVAVALKNSSIIKNVKLGQSKTKNIENAFIKFPKINPFLFPILWINIVRGICVIIANSEKKDVDKTIIFQVTLTPYKKDIEPNVPPKVDIIEQ